MQFHVKSRASTVMDGMVAATRQVITAKPKLAELKITFNLGETQASLPEPLMHACAKPVANLVSRPLHYTLSTTALTLHFLRNFSTTHSLYHFSAGHPCQPIPYALFNLLDTPTIPILHCPLRGPHWQFTVLFMAFPSHPLWGTLSVFATIKLARTGITCWWTDIQCIRIQE